MVVYLAFCTANGKTYVGQTKKKFETRKREHVCYAKNPIQVFHRAIRKYGPEAFEWQVLAEVETKPEADKLERVWIAVLDSINMGYNVGLGGSGQMGFRMSEGSRRKMREAKLNTRHSEQHKANQAIAQKNRKYSPDWPEQCRQVWARRKGLTS